MADDNKSSRKSDSPALQGGEAGASAADVMRSMPHALGPEKSVLSSMLKDPEQWIGMALEEESVLDQTFGRFMNHSLGEYHVPVNADIHGIDVIFVEEFDEIVNPLGAKGLGEIGVVGVASAIANAVYNATGHRIRRLPITLDKVL